MPVILCTLRTLLLEGWHPAVPGSKSLAPLESSCLPENTAGFVEAVQHTLHSCKPAACVFPPLPASTGYTI